MSLYYFHRFALLKEQFVILSKTGSRHRQPNLFLFFSLSSALEHELKTHISDVLNTVYLLLVQIGCFHIFKKFFNSATNHTLLYRCRTDFADIQNKKECGGNRQWQRRFLRNWAANMSGKEIT